MDKLTLFSAIVTLFQLVATQENGVRILKPIHASFAPSNSRIIGGEEVEPHSIPYQVALHMNNDAYCGGALISPNYVLTAGHCGIIIDTVEVILGAHNLSNSNEGTQVRIQGEETIVHEEYDDETLYNDIAIIKLAEAAPINNIINIVPLPSDDSSNYANKVATASGWGLPKDVPYPSTKDMSDILLKVDVPITNLTDCMDYYNDQEGEHVYETSICTSGYGNKGTCNGDSGGPLVLDGVLIGLTSFGTDLCEVCSPSVYVRVGSYLEWILKNSDVENN